MLYASVRDCKAIERTEGEGEVREKPGQTRGERGQLIISRSIFVKNFYEYSISTSQKSRNTLSRKTRYTTAIADRDKEHIDNRRASWVWSKKWNGSHESNWAIDKSVRG